MDNNIFVKQFLELPYHLCPICGKESHSASQICSEHSFTTLQKPEVFYYEPVKICPNQGGHMSEELEQSISEYREAYEKGTENPEGT